jgi:hypothetical protein
LGCNITNNSGRILTLCQESFSNKSGRKVLVRWTA